MSARIGLSRNEYETLPEGDYEFTVTAAEYNETFGKISVTLMTDDGKKMIESYNLLKQNGETNDGALKAFSWLCRSCLGDDIDDVAVEELIDTRCGGHVEHQSIPSRDDPSKEKVFAKITKRWKVESKPVAPATAPKATPAADNSLDLDDLLGF